MRAVPTSGAYVSVQLVSGDESVLVAEAVTRIVKDALGDDDRSLALEQLDETNLRDPDGGWRLAPLLDAAQTEPFLTSRRVVVGRHLARFSRKGDCDDLVRLLETLPATTHLVLVWERGVDPVMGGRLPTVPKALTAAVKAAGGTSLNVTPPRGKSDAHKWLRGHLEQSGLHFEPAAVAAIDDLVGADHGNIVGLLRTLEGALGSGATVSAGDVAVYGGDPGSVVPWELDDAIDRGDITEALRVLHRLVPSRHPSAVAGCSGWPLPADAASRWSGRCRRASGSGVLGNEGFDLPGPQDAGPDPQAWLREGGSSHPSAGRRRSRLCGERSTGPTSWCLRCWSPG